MNIVRYTYKNFKLKKGCCSTNKPVTRKQSLVQEKKVTKASNAYHPILS